MGSLGGSQLPGGAPTSFLNLPAAPKDETFHLFDLFARDQHPDKVSLGGGVYRTDKGEPWPLSVVQKAEERLHQNADVFRHEYTSMVGDTAFVRLAQDLVFGFSPDDDASRERIASIQTISGSGANHLIALFLATHLRPRAVWLSDPTWANHKGMWNAVGVPIKEYPYYDPVTRCLNFDGLVRVLDEEAQEGDVVLLQAAAHNPTGIDPTKDQWRIIADICQRRGLFPLFDSAYQGFASGDLVQDAWAIRYFHSLGMEMAVAQSFSKNLGLYGQRTGALHLVLAPVAAGLRATAVDNLSVLVRQEYSVPPRAGATIAREVLSSKALFAEWLQNLQVMSGRIKGMRRALYDELVALGTPGGWEHIVDQIGMFSYLGISPEQVDVLRSKYHIYLLASGRASISGLNPSNVKYVAKALDDVVRNIQ
jgi:aspartate aminotransferase